MGLPGSSERPSSALCAALISLAEACACGAHRRRLVAVGAPACNKPIIRGVQRIEFNPRPCGVEMDTHCNIKTDKAAIIKRRIYPPNLSRGILIVLLISMFDSFPRGTWEI